MRPIGEAYVAARVTNVSAYVHTMKRWSIMSRGFRPVSVNHQHLRAFHAIATEGSISRAARRLNVAQPTLSQQLKALEGRHQAALFEGRKPPLRLTTFGQQLFDLTQKLFVTSQDIDDLLKDPEGRMTSDMRLG